VQILFENQNSVGERTVNSELCIAFMLLCGFALLPVHGQTNSAIRDPSSETRGAATQLIVDGKPFLVLGAEVHNSSTSSLPYTEPVLAGYSSQHVNTALAAVTWEMLEPEEGNLISPSLTASFRKRGATSCASFCCGLEAGKTACPPIHRFGSRPT